MTTLVSPLSMSGTARTARDEGKTIGGGFMQSLVGWFAEQRRYRRTLAELSTLTDRELDDIGLTRGEVEFVARRSARGT